MIGVESAMTGTTGTAAIMGNSPAPAATEAPAVASEPAGESAETPAASPPPSAVGVKGGKSAEPVVPAYTPNHKFKVLDKERDFDDWAKAGIKDADTEKKVRELYEKAYGLDFVKQERQTIRSELDATRQKVQEQDKAIETLGSYAKSKDWDSFFEALSIPKNDILSYALALVQREQMPPEQKAQWEASRQAQQQAKYYQEQNQQLQSSQQQFMVQQREWELNQEISKQDYSGVVQAYNAGMGNPGAFRDYVVKIGVAYDAQGQDISVGQAVAEAVKHLRAVNPSLGMPQQTQAVSQVVAPSNKPVIPNIQGRGTSAVKSTVRSLDDIRAKAKELASQT
jgi:hypothetical protein